MTDRLTPAQLRDPVTVGHAVGRLRTGVRAPDDRTAGVLFWYSLSGALARAALLDGADAGRAGVTVGPQGWPSEIDAPPTRCSAHALGTALRALLPPVAAASGARERTLWAITTDSIAGAALAAGVAPHEALAACGPAAPPARYEIVAGRGTVVRRGSCCLLYLCEDGSKCLSCPRQPPSTRLRRLIGGR
jgi:hypothetical protein